MPEPGSDAFRASPKLKKVAARQVPKRPPMRMTDDEVYNRPLPDGLQTDGSQPRQHEVEREGGSIRHNPADSKAMERSKMHRIHVSKQMGEHDRKMKRMKAGSKKHQGM